MANVTLLHYNNYFNRTIKKLSTLAEYITADSNYNKTSNVNFVPGDGIYTSLVLGTSSLSMGYDYVVVTEVENNTEVIKSRWFLMEENRTRDGQYEIVLRRDVIADHFDEVMNATTYVEKGTVQYNDPLIFNNENLLVNQIKKAETLLKDRTQVPWLIGYIAKNAPTGSHLPPWTINYNPANQDYIEVSAANLEAWQYYGYIGTYFKGPFSGNPSFITRIRSGNWVGYNWVGWFKETRGNSSTVYDAGWYKIDSDPGINVGWNTSAESVASALYTAYQNYGYSNMESALATALDLHTQTQINNLLYYNGKVIKFQDGKYYNVTVTAVADEIVDTRNIPNNGTYSGIRTAMLNAATSTGLISGTPTDSAFAMSYRVPRYNILVEEIDELAVKVNFSAARYKTRDASNYDIFAIPYGDITIGINNGGTVTNITMTKQLGMAAMIGIAENLTSSQIYDLQLLPYCPVQNLINSQGKIILDASTEHGAFDYIVDTSTDPDANIGVLFYVTESNFTFNIFQSFNIDMSDTSVSNAINLKVENECNMYKLVSPNYQGEFQFSLAKNGNISYFNVDCTYKPFNPYIHVNPNFSGLYGSDFNDSRGLVCNGDFSFGMYNNAFTTYELQNKNYQAIFDRQIQNMDVNNAISRQEAGWQIASGAISGTASGAISGAMVGGGYGAIAGAVVGAATSIAGGIADYQNLVARQVENKAYSIDMYNYSLQNVKALPYSISKCTALTYNNKLFPFIEKYSCTDEEKALFKKKLKYDGMTVLAVGKLADYVGNDTLVRGEIIRFDNQSYKLNEDSHMANEIYNEIKKGVYI